MMDHPAPAPANQFEQPKRRSNFRSRILITVLALFVGVLGWEYRNIHNQQSSLARMHQEVLRHQAVGEPISRDELAKLVQGSPARTSEMGDFEHVDYYSWRGLLHASHIRVVANPSDAVLSAQNDLFGPVPSSDHRAASKQNSAPGSSGASTTISQGSLHSPSVSFSPNVQQVLAQAAQVHRATQGASVEFVQMLRSVADDLPELEVSMNKGQLIWNSLRLSRQNQRLFAFRFRIPGIKIPETQIVSWYNQGNYSGILAARGQTFDFLGVEYGVWWDEEYNVAIEGASLPPQNGVRFRSTGKIAGGNANYIHWFVTFDDHPEIDLESRILIFASDRTQRANLPSLQGADEISDFLGLKTNIRRFPPTSEGARDAVRLVNERLSSGYDRGAIMPGRILRPAAAGLEELKCSHMLGQAEWQQITFPVANNTAAYRVRIPDSIGSNADVYGAVISTQNVQIGWDKAGATFGRFQSREFSDVTVPDSPLSSSGNLLLFSQHEGQLTPGSEFVFWIHKNGAGDDPMFVTLSILPHTTANPGHDQNSASSQPLACGRITGVKVPPYPSPDGCRVLACHERWITQLKFTGDGSRLLSVDDLGHTQIWNVDPPQFEGQVELTFYGTESVFVDPTGQTLLSHDNVKHVLRKWNIKTREPLATVETYLRGNSDIRGAAFGPEPQQLVIIHRLHGSLTEHEHQFAFLNLQDDQPPRLSEKIRESTRNNYYSMVYLPSVNLFAAGRTRLADGSANQNGTIVSTVELWPPDFSKPVRELLLGEHVDYEKFMASIPVYVSAHPDGRRLAAACEQGQVKVWDIGTWTELMSKQVEPRPSRSTNPFQARSHYKKPVLGIWLSPDGESVNVAERFNNAVTVWNVSDGTSEPRYQVETPDLPTINEGLIGPRSNVDESEETIVTQSPNGKWVATADLGGVVRLWKVGD